MAKPFRRKGDRLVARLDDVEREVVVGLMTQTHDLLAPTRREPTGDPFEDLVARLGLPRMSDLSDLNDFKDNLLLDGDTTADVPKVRRDPALDRLLPSAHREDDEMAAEFRRLTEHGLRDRKATNLSTAISALQDSDGDKVRLSHEQAQAMVVALTDVRLLLGDRLGLRTDDDAEALQDRLEEASQDDPEIHLAAYYDFMTWLQESLTLALMDM